MPFAKTGGLADVCGALPRELAKLGHNASVILPAFRSTRQSGRPIEGTGIQFDVPIGSRIVRGRLLKSTLPDSDVPVYLVEQDEYYDRPELYRASGEDYRDNCERFVFFCRAVMETIRLAQLPVDVIHCNDWQTGLIPALQAIDYRHTHGYEKIVTLMTIHNMAYQGNFPANDMHLTGLDWKYFNWQQLEFYDNLNLLKTGLVFSDAINTVSPRYALEIQSSDMGCGLEGVLQSRSAVLSGIVNGVDYGIWNPAIDPHLPMQYDEHNWSTGKAFCKAALQREVGLPQEAGVPLVGLIGRLADQKGWDLVEPCIRQWAAHRDVQWVVLGSGEPHYQETLQQLASQYPHRVAVKLAFSDELAHRIEAGSDMFLMPSRYEPCGLNQLYSLQYGSVPIVRETGGLADTICDASPENLADRVANGFSFEEYSLPAMENALEKAVALYQQSPESWGHLVVTGMRQDWSWSNSAARYVSLYQAMMARA